ncbi:MAG: hypothetical protein JWM46_918 [Candidatus Kaiserbacteria bacterium]|nr:hypothetical protein [Candidatus Kaiserbacteria bacterium]
MTVHKRTRVRSDDRFVYVLIGTVILTVLLVASGLWRSLYRAADAVRFRISPSAATAFSIAEQHFDAEKRALYDLDEAQKYFAIASSKDPGMIYVFHELARVSFLRGDYARAFAEITLQINLHGNETPNSYYVRGLIEGYMGAYAASAADYEHFLKTDPHNWAAMNDYAWVLLKANRFQDAAVVTTEGLRSFPDNPWLLNSQAIALYEMNAFSSAYGSETKASAALGSITEAQWLHAYPGNDPRIAQEGIASFKKSVSDNMHMMALAAATSTVQ